jgi:hypothetical protein
MNTTAFHVAQSRNEAPKAIGTPLVGDSLDNIGQLGIAVTVSILFVNGFAIFPVNDLKFAGSC